MLHFIVDRQIKKYKNLHFILFYQFVLKTQHNNK